MYTVTQLAKEVGCSRQWVNTEISVGHLTAKRIGKQYVITNKAAHDWIKARRNRTPSKGG